LFPVGQGKYLLSQICFDNRNAGEPLQFSVFNLTQENVSQLMSVCRVDAQVIVNRVMCKQKLAAKFPYSRAFLPVNRLEDGSMYNW